MKDLSIKGQLLSSLIFKGSISGENYDANNLSESGIYLIRDPAIKNANNLTWSFLICLKFDINSTLQFLIQTDDVVTIWKRKLSPTGYTPNSEWMKIG